LDVVYDWRGPVENLELNRLRWTRPSKARMSRRSPHGNSRMGSRADTPCGGPRRHRLRCRHRGLVGRADKAVLNPDWPAAHHTETPRWVATADTQVAGQRGSSEDDLPLWLNHAQDRGVGRGLNPAPDERRPAVTEYDERVEATTRRHQS